MCKVMEEMCERSLKEGIKEGMKIAALRMLEVGKYALDEIAALSGLSVDEVERLQVEEKV